MDLKYVGTLLAIIFLTLIISRFFLNKKSDTWQRIFYYSFIVGLIIYSGIAAANFNMPYYYINFYFGFLISFCFSFKIFSIIFSRVSNYSNIGLKAALIKVDISNKWMFLIYIYFFLNLIPLIFPILRLNLIFSPPVPDLLASFERQLEAPQVNFLIKISEYAVLLLSPFFYIALFRFRINLYKIIVILFIQFYLQYIITGYKSRGEFLVVIGTIFISVWVCRANLRKYLFAGAALAAPFILILFNIYEYTRVGASTSAVDFSLINSMNYILSSETDLPLIFGIPLMESNKHADLLSYFLWIFTLPIPKIITGEISGSRITYEISEIVLGVKREDPRFYVILTGLVGESYYLYGKYFFWLHGVFIGVIVAFISKIFHKIPQLLFLNSFLAMMILYNLNRSGVSAFLPQIINQLLFFYFFIFLNLNRRNIKNKF